ncbi:MAG: ATP-binding protein [Acidobacteria bacterium]|nr:ATP-binding protein [Acidobacteriota bacterium]
MQDYEKLGVFYLGREFDLESGKRKDSLVLYDSKDLVTHGVCVGMTGSGKTGLCLALLEEAAIDGVPVIAVDPKGDLGNLLLTFPNLAPGDFRPWINEDDARRKGMSADEFATEQASTWKSGLAEWGEDGERIGRLRAAADFAIYTPGSSAGLPLSILRSLDAPPAALREDREMLAERVTTTATSLLTLAGIDTPPRSREHILLSTILSTAWNAGNGLDLAAIIQQVQQPPVQRVGVMELESFFPSKDRFDLATAFNNVLAAPDFQSWMDGEPLNVDRLFFTPEGKPRISVISIAHLGDRERMFFVSLLLNELVGWMRAQQGTTSLRALFYMDEIFGFFPPVANPPSKTPFLTLLKQGRAFGLGCLLATQNPVDLDYKGLANAGTWWLGRLQTERDKQRVLDGLEGAVAAGGGRFDRSYFDQALSRLSTRIFLMNNVHEDAPVVMESRWAMSYLRGPLTREQIRLVMSPRKALAPPPVPPPAPAVPTGAPAAGPAPAVRAASVAAAGSAVPATPRPVLAPDIPQFFVPRVSAKPAGGALTYLPMALGVGSVAFSDARSGVSHTRALTIVAEIEARLGSVAWADATAIDVPAKELGSEPETGAQFGALPPSAAKAKTYEGWSKTFKAWLAQSQSLTLLKSSQTGAVSAPDESERDFRIRLQTLTREQRDQAVDQMRQKYAAKVAALDEKIRRAQQAVDRESEQASQQKLQTAVSLGATVLGALFGRKTLSTSTLGRATTTARGVGRTMKESQDIELAKQTLAAAQQQKSELEASIQADVAALGGAMDPLTETLAPLMLKPKRTDVAVEIVALAWVPVWQDTSGGCTPAWKA